jgi:Uma2 family endonuclease
MTAPVAYRKPKERPPADLAHLLVALGNISPERVLRDPPIGQATEQHLLRPPNGSDSLYELIDGTLVEKAMGFEESRLTSRMIAKLDTFADEHGLGRVAGPDGNVRFAPGLVRLPDVSYFSKARARHFVRGQAITGVVPDLGVEVLSKGNTRAEIERKLSEFFAAGVRLAWVMDPRKREVRVYTAPDTYTTLSEEDVLDGGDVVPGFRYSIKEWLSVLDPIE